MRPIPMGRDYSATVMNPKLGRVQWSYGWAASIPVSEHIAWIAVNTRDACCGRLRSAPIRSQP